MDATDAFEAAKLAALVGGQLKTIDKYSTERSSNPANKININAFINNVKNPNAKVAPARYLVEPPAGFAPPPPEEYVQASVPDTSIGSLPINNSSLTQPPVQQLQTQTNMPIPAHVPAPAPAHESYYKEISETLKSIDNTLHDMLTYLKENNIR